MFTGKWHILSEEIYMDDQKLFENSNRGNFECDIHEVLTVFAENFFVDRSNDIVGCIDAKGLLITFECVFKKLSFFFFVLAQCCSIMLFHEVIRKCLQDF